MYFAVKLTFPDKSDYRIQKNQKGIMHTLLSDKLRGPSIIITFVVNHWGAPNKGLRLHPQNLHRIMPAKGKR